MGTLVLTGLCVLLIIVATFTQVTLKHPYIPFDTLSFLAVETNETEILHHFIKSYKYIPQIPVVFFIVALMGRKFGILSIILYIICYYICQVYLLIIFILYYLFEFYLLNASIILSTALFSTNFSA